MQNKFSLKLMLHLRDRHPEARSKRREDPGFTEIKKLIITKNCKL